MPPNSFDYGPGYRMYFTIRQTVIAVLLIGSSKKGQSEDIAKAKKLAKELLIGE